MAKYILTVVYILFTTGGLTFMKLGGDTLKVGLKGGFSFSMDWKTLVGFLMYIVSFILWQQLLVKYDLSKIVPIVTGIVQIVIMLIAAIVFKEEINVMGWIGAALIIAGIVLIAFATKK